MHLKTIKISIRHFFFIHKLIVKIKVLILKIIITKENFTLNSG